MAAHVAVDHIQRHIVDQQRGELFASHVGRRRAATAAEPAAWRDCVTWLDAHDTLSSAADWPDLFGCLTLAGNASAEFDAYPTPPAPELDMMGFIFRSPAALFPLAMNDGASHAATALMNELATDSTLSQTLADLDVPTLIIHGRHDLVAPWQVGVFVIDTIATPEADRRRVVLEHTAHGSFREQDEAEYQAEVLTFVRDHTE